MKNEISSENSGGSPVIFIHARPLLRKIILFLQYVLAVTVTTMGIMLWTGSMDFKNTAHFLALLSILTGMIIYTSCTAYGIITMKKFFAAFGLAGLLAGTGSALVFWQKLPVDAWYYCNLVLVLGICLSLFTETEKGRTIKSVVHVVASIIILITLFFMLLHVLGLVDMKLPLFILIGAVVVLLILVVLKNKKITS